ncbi:MAG: DUF6361 family protein [Acidobacteria bacterium]|nr:DUF6361 family protein [Acidobacteriota bacterium]
MQATLTWLDLTASDRDKMRRVLDLFKEQGTLDEMGLGSLRDVLSEALFPGTSSIQTRLGYVLFIPWLYRRLEDRKVRAGEVQQAARRAEIDLIGPLETNSDGAGIIGQRARGALVRLPSSVYWGALTRWGVFQPQQSQGWYQSRFDALVSGRGAVGRADDPGVVWSRQPHWHPRLPKPPAGFPWEASFALTRDEADFLRGRVEERCAGTLLAWLVRNGSESPAPDVWDDPDALRAPDGIRETLELARRFSLHVEGLPWLYNLVVAERRREVLDSDEDESIDEFRAGLLAPLQPAGRHLAASPARCAERGRGRRVGLLAARAALLPAGQPAGGARRAVAPALGAGLVVRGRQRRRNRRGVRAEARPVVQVVHPARARVHAEFFRPERGGSGARVERDEIRVRTVFALRFGHVRTDEGEHISQDAVRAAVQQPVSALRAHAGTSLRPMARTPSRHGGRVRVRTSGI